MLSRAAALSYVAARCGGTFSPHAPLPADRPEMSEVVDRSLVIIDTDNGGDPGDATIVTCVAGLPEPAVAAPASLLADGAH